MIISTSAFNLAGVTYRYCHTLVFDAEDEKWTKKSKEP